jgi:hypothetical protein
LPYPYNPQSTDAIRPGRPFVITPSDSADLPHIARAISFAVAGAIKVVDEFGVDCTIPADSLAAGVQHSIIIRKVYDTGTDATGIVGYA